MAQRTIHPSLTRQLKMGGVPRNWAIVNGMVAASMGVVFYMAHLWLMVALWAVAGVVVHLLLAKACQKDDRTLDAYLRHIGYSKVYSGRTHPDAPSATVKSFRK